MSDSHYTATAKLLHWFVAGMIVLQFVLAQLADNAGSDLRELALLANHKSVGITILVVAIVRIAWRLRHKAPPLPATMPSWQVAASSISHWSLYGLLFALPITGWLMSSASAYTVSWFNLFQLPDFVAPDPGLADTFEEVHEVLAGLLLAVASLHILAALKHHFFDKDDVLTRMLSYAGIAVFVFVATFGAIQLSDVGGSGSSGPASPSVQRDADVTLEQSSSSLPLWQIDYGRSHIRFTGDQAGAEFDGVWGTWSAELQFSSDDLAASVFTVVIETATADTQDADRDATISDPEWFDSTNFPEAYFRANRFSRSDDGSFVADGELVIKEVASPTEFRFTVDVDGDQRILTGSAELDRLVLRVGTGEWEDTEWVGADVTVDVRVEAVISD